MASVKVNYCTFIVALTDYLRMPPRKIREEEEAIAPGYLYRSKEMRNR